LSLEVEDFDLQLKFRDLITSLAYKSDNDNVCDSG